VKYLSLSAAAGRPLSVLCLGAHADDVEIGCGGTLLQLLAEHPKSVCRWIVFSATPEREAEARASATGLLKGQDVPVIDVHKLRDGHFPSVISEIKDTLEAVKRAFTPDLIFTHYRDDRHQDHRAVSDATWQTFREHLILEYEVPKYDGDLGQPNCFVPVSASTRQRKIEHLSAAFPSQRSKQWFTDETFSALMRLRGIECAAPDGYAEAFYARKWILTPGAATNAP
jgi:LmbE family N-acetylglucosaminyl deacetylase